MLDTHVLIWAAGAPDKIESRAQAAICDGGNDVFVSAATAWEIAIKRALGRLEFPLERFSDMMATLGFRMLPILATHAIVAGSLPRHHSDPFDRMLVGQTIIEGLTLLTEDVRLHQYDVKIFGRS